MNMGQEILTLKHHLHFEQNGKFEVVSHLEWGKFHPYPHEYVQLKHATFYHQMKVIKQKFIITEYYEKTVGRIKYKFLKNFFAS